MSYESPKPKVQSPKSAPKTLGSLFAGIGGFDLGFERAGWQTKWQVENNPIARAVLADRFPAAQRFGDINTLAPEKLAKVDCITAGFPCQDISIAGKSNPKKPKLGLHGPRSGLFFQALRIIEALQPKWVVLENVPALLHSNDSQDIERVIAELARRDYLGFARLLDAQYFGSPARRHRLFLVAGLGCHPHLDFLADAAPVEGLPSTFTTRPELWRDADSWAAFTLLASNTPGRISLGSENLVAHQNGWGQMVERRRIAESDGLPWGLDAENFAERHAAGNAVVPQIAQWIAEKLNKS